MPKKFTKPRSKEETPRVVRRDRKDKPRSEADFDARDTSTHRLPRRFRLTDARVGAPIRGVSNADARLVYEKRVAHLRNLLATRSDPNEPELAQQLIEAMRLGLWRARRIASFEAFIENVLELSMADATRLIGQEASDTNVANERQSDEIVAVWMRCEAALIDAGMEGAATIEVDPQDRIVFRLSPRHAPQVLVAVSKKLTPLIP